MAGLILLLAPAARAQPAAGLDPGKRLREYIHESWQTEHGLPQATVTSIAQTPDGYLWSGSQLGLTRFDGVAFTTFTTRNAPGLTDVHISALHVDRAGVLWVGTSIGGIGTFRNGRFSAIPEDGPASIVSAIHQDRAGAMWAGTGTGLMRLSKGQFRTVPGVVGAVNALAEDRDGALLVGTDSGLFHALVS